MISVNHMANTDEWPSNHRYLKEIDTALRCGICYEYITTAMMVRHCSHNYCSLCIRQYLSFKTECPTCRKSTVDSDLLNNRLVDDIIHLFVSGRSALLNLVKQEGPDSLVTKKENSSIQKTDQSPSKPEINSLSTTNTPVSTKMSSSAKVSGHRSIMNFCTKTNLSLIEREELIRKPKSAKKHYAVESGDSNSDSDVILCDDSDDDFQPTSAKKYKSFKLDSDCEDDDYVPPSSSKRKRTSKGKANGKWGLTPKQARYLKYDSVLVDKFNDEDSMSRQSYEELASPPSPVFSKSQDKPQESGDFTSNVVSNPLDETLILSKSINDTQTGLFEGKQSKECESPFRTDFSVKNRVDEVMHADSNAVEPSCSSATATTNSLNSSNSEKVCCPVCNVSISAKNINLHLDSCLAGSEKKQALRNKTPTRQKSMPKLVYNLMKDSEIRKRLAEVGLPTQGDRQKLISLHKELTLKYNALCDSLNPKSVKDVVKEILKENDAKNKSIFKPSSVERLQISKNATAAQIRSSQRAYINHHKAQFKELISETRKRMKKTAAKSKSDESAETMNSLPNVPETAKTANEIDINETQINMDLDLNLETVKQLMGRGDEDTNSKSVRVVKKLDNVEFIEDESRDLFDCNSPQSPKEVPKKDILKSDLVSTKISLEREHIPCGQVVREQSNTCDGFSITSSYNSITFQTQTSHLESTSLDDDEKVNVPIGIFQADEISSESTSETIIQDGGRGEVEEGENQEFDVLHGMTEDPMDPKITQSLEPLPEMPVKDDRSHTTENSNEETLSASNCVTSQSGKKTKRGKKRTRSLEENTHLAPPTEESSKPKRNKKVKNSQEENMCAAQITKNEDKSQKRQRAAKVNKKPLKESIPAQTVSDCDDTGDFKRNKVAKKGKKTGSINKSSLKLEDVSDEHLVTAIVEDVESTKKTPKNKRGKKGRKDSNEGLLIASATDANSIDNGDSEVHVVTTQRQSRRLSKDEKKTGITNSNKKTGRKKTK